jgi:hypothetical protein
VCFIAKRSQAEKALPIRMRRFYTLQAGAQEAGEGWWDEVQLLGCPRLWTCRAWLVQIDRLDYQRVHGCEALARIAMVEVIAVVLVVSGVLGERRRPVLLVVSM